MLTLFALLVSQDHVRVRDQEVRVYDHGTPRLALAPSDVHAAYPPVCQANAEGKQGEPVPGGGTLDPLAFLNPANVYGSSAGVTSAFVASVSGSVRNQGVFVHGGGGLVTIAMGSGAQGGGGSTGTAGDASPLGGTFSGFFQGTAFAPAVNARGDVLFVADVFGGSAPRGLFLYLASSASLVTVAAVGGATPLGGTFARIGPGSLSDTGVVAFLASELAGTASADVFRWDGGALSVVAATGDAAPLGSTYQFLGSETLGFVDGSFVPIGPLPDIDAAGNVVFRAITAAGRRGIVHNDEFDTQVWLVRDQEAAPGGGTFFDLQGASLNARGEIAFFADVRLGPSSFTAAWFAGTSGNFRRALGFGDALGGATVNGLAFSRNPMSPLDDDGNLIQWVDVQLAGGGQREQVVVVAPDGAVTIVARRNEATPLGGSYNGFDAWPSLVPDGNPAHGGFSASYGGVPGSTSAHFAFQACLAARAVARNGSGTNTACFAAAPPVLGSTWQASVDARGHAGATLTVILGHALPHAGLASPYGELLLDLGSPRVLRSAVAGGGLVAHAAAVPADLALLGRSASLQALILGGGVELCNAVDVVLGY